MERPTEPMLRKDRFNIIAEILEVAQDGTSKTQVMHRTNLNIYVLEKYLKVLSDLKLLKISSSASLLRTTNKGMLFINKYREIISEEREKPIFNRISREAP